VQVRAYRIGKTKRAPEWGKKVWQEITAVAPREMDDLLKDFNATVKDWKPENRPGFAGGVNVGTSGSPNWTGTDLVIEVKPVGNTKVWGYVTGGTGLYGPKHAKYPIVPRKKKALAFRAGYAPRTQPGPPATWGGPGRASGAMVVRKKVMHPGIKPRRINLTIQARHIPRWQKRVHEAIERGMYRARMHYI